MITEDDLKKFLDANEPRKIIIHDGYDGWSYGMPLDPIFISNETILRLVKIIVHKYRQINVFDVLLSDNDIEYAKEEDKLYRKTFNNRFLGLYSPDECKFKERSKFQEQIDIVF